MKHYAVKYNWLNPNVNEYLVYNEDGFIVCHCPIESYAVAYAKKLEEQWEKDHSKEEKPKQFQGAIRKRIQNRLTEATGWTEDEKLHLDHLIEQFKQSIDAGVDLCMKKEIADVSRAMNQIKAYEDTVHLLKDLLEED